MIKEYAPIIVYTLLVFIILLFALLIKTYKDNSNKVTVTDIQNMCKANQKRRRKEDKRAVKPNKLPIIGSVWLIELGERNERKVKIENYLKSNSNKDMIRLKELNVSGTSILPLHMWDELNKELLR